MPVEVDTSGEREGRKNREDITKPQWKWGFAESIIDFET
jgi:hypothetical protein